MTARQSRLQGTRFGDLTIRVAAGLAFGALALAAILIGRYGVIGLTAICVIGIAAEWRSLIGKGLSASLAVGGTLYLAMASFSFIYIYFGPYFEITHEQGRDNLIWLLLVVIANDCFAYGVGRWLGGIRLAPALSPNKTWSGTVGGIAGAGVVGALSGWLVIAANPLLLAATAIILAILAQIGDLAESLVKRTAGVKDAGSILPGHGGLLDRVDGLAAAAIGLAVAQAVTGQSALDWP